jgi:hypothetical protein
MGIKERRERDKKELKGLIMETTAGILIKEGYERTTIRKVASTNPEALFTPQILEGIIKTGAPWVFPLNYSGHSS